MEKNKLTMYAWGVLLMALLGAFLILISIFYFKWTANYDGLFQTFALVGTLFFTIPFLAVSISAQLKKR